MKAKIGGNARDLYGPLVPDLKAVGKKSFEWDLNDYKWDGDLFTASSLNSAPSDCRRRQVFPVWPETPADACLSNNSSSAASEDINLGNDKGKREFEKRRRALFVGDQGLNQESGKKTKIVGSTFHRAICQVEDCRVDLSNAKDYHRRHKVCSVHSKASEALVGNVMQRFCQQCSRFHVLQEFDEGRRSCRRRLAGHNRRRRKTNPETEVNGVSLNDERGSNYLLISLLRILSNLPSNSSSQMKDQDLISHLLRTLATFSGTVDGRNISALLQGSQGLSNAQTSAEASQKAVDLTSNAPKGNLLFGSASKVNHFSKLEEPSEFIGCGIRLPASDMTQERIGTDGSLHTLSDPGSMKAIHSGNRLPAEFNTSDMASERSRIKNIDLNIVYDDSQDHVENLAITRNVSPYNPLWIQCESQKTRPPHQSGNSDSTSAKSPSRSSGEDQSRTDRIVFKLFGKDPNDLPLLLRKQILDWLSHSPTDIESYIRPGCIILTIYIRLEKSMWDQLCLHLGTSLKRLLDASNDPFWRTGWVYTRVHHFVAFLYNGQVVLDTPLPLNINRKCRVSSIKPIAVPLSERVHFAVKGFNLFHSSARILCALEGKYLVQESCYELMESTNTTVDHDEVQCINFSCSMPSVTGRGFIEVEDNGLSSSFYPIIVAEQEVCSEICILEEALDLVETADGTTCETEKMEAKDQALEFIHEMGWLLHRSSAKLRLGHVEHNLDLFPLRRFRCLMEFSLDRNWGAVVKKLLDILFEGTVDSGEHPSIVVAILDMGLLHRAVRKKYRPMVELLLKFIPDTVLDKAGSNESQQAENDEKSFLFKPNSTGPMGLTPLHIAASMDGCEEVLDALTDDPGKVGIEAWKTARDSTGLTPNDYACLRGHYSYINLVKGKVNKSSESVQVVLDIPITILDYSSKQRQPDWNRSSKVASLESERFEAMSTQKHCKVCVKKFAYGRTSLLYRPAMISMVTIAAVCVCVALLFKSSPQVLYVMEPFRWERLKYGAM